MQRDALGLHFSFSWCFYAKREQAQDNKYGTSSSRKPNFIDSFIVLTDMHIHFTSQMPVKPNKMVRIP